MLWKILGPILGPVLDRVIPDVNARQAAQEAMKAAIESNDSALLLEQIKVNALEAQHPSVFVAGPRPFILWVLGISLAGLFLGYLFWPVVAAAVGAQLPPPPNDNLVDLLLYLVTGLYGLRAYEGIRGVKNRR